MHKIRLNDQPCFTFAVMLCLGFVSRRDSRNLRQYRAVTLLKLLKVDDEEVERMIAEAVAAFSCHVQPVKESITWLFVRLAVTRI